MFRIAFAVVTLAVASQTAQAQSNGSPPAGAKSALAGAYTAEQATRGENEHRMLCTSCHTTTNYSGATFKQLWTGRTVYDLFDLIKGTMPQDNPSGLSDQQYADIVAYILKLNGYPAGSEPLPADPEALRPIKIDPKPDQERR
jgi:mono/diheme cytochrome c family protein